MARLEVIKGPMFAEKSEELIRRLKRVAHARKESLVIKPRRDTRTENLIAARSKNEAGKFEPWVKFPAIPVSTKEEFFALLEEKRPDVLGLDEAQFFDNWLIEAVQWLLPHQYVHKIIVAGLDMDAWGKPFGPMPALLSMADDVSTQTAVCFKCGAEANMTQKVSKGSGELIEVGDAGLYEARCRSCWTPPPED